MKSLMSNHLKFNLEKRVFQSNVKVKPFLFQRSIQMKKAFIFLISKDKEAALRGNGNAKYATTAILTTLFIAGFAGINA